MMYRQWFLCASMLAATTASIAVPHGGVDASLLEASVPAQAEAPTQVCESRDILLLIDQSQSLQTSDPQNIRADGAKELVKGLVTAELDVKLSVAGFGNEVSIPTAFQLPAQSKDAEAEIDVVASQADDGNTDYVLAILAAAEYFEASQVPSHCQTLVWFTDGAYDIDDAEFASSYTDLTDVDEIKASFEEAVCGPANPPGFRLEEPLANKIRRFQFVIRMIDLRVAKQSGSAASDRAMTDAVVKRLLTDGEDGDCGVNGTRIEATQADELVKAFFDESQDQAGRTLVECDVLSNGVPASIVSSVGVFATSDGDAQSARQIDLLVGDEIVASGVQSLQYEMATTDRSRPAPLSVRVTGGQPASCFLQLSAAIEAVGEPSLYQGAPSTPAYLVVGGAGVATSPLSGVGADHVALTVTFDGLTVPPTWNPSIGQWVVDLPAQTGDQASLAVTGEFVGALSGLGVVEPFAINIPVKDVPALPQIRWDGDTAVEGTNTMTGVLEVSPTADVDGEVCVQFNSLPSIVRTVDGAQLGQLNTETDRICGSANEPLRVPASVDVENSANAVGTADLQFSATFTPPGEEAKDMGRGDVIFPEFAFSKPVDSSTQLRLAALLAIASAVLTYLIMQVLTAMQAKLRPPSEMVMVTTSLERDPANARLERVDGHSPIRLSDMRQVVGSRRRYDLGDGLTLRRRLSPNPFRGLSAVVESNGPSVFAHPAAGAASRRQRRVPVPLRFGTLVLVASGETSRTIALVPMATSPTGTATIIDEGLRRLDGQIRTAPTFEGSRSADPTVTADVEHDSMPPPRQNLNSKLGAPASPSSAPSAAPTPRPTSVDSSAATSTRKPPPPPHRS